MSEEFEYMEKPKTAETPEEVWCKIGPTGELEVFNWQFVEKMAAEYDATGPVSPKTNAQIICKLAVLIRKQTLATAAEALLKLKDQSAVSTVLVLRDPLEEIDEDQA
jgi:hypothetical protein